GYERRTVTGKSPADERLLVARHISLVTTLCERHERSILRAYIVRARTNDLPVDTLLDDVSGPACRTREHEERREHRGRYAHQVVGHGGIPVEVRKQILDFLHHPLETLCNREHLHVARRLRERARDLLDHLVARIGD